MREEIILGASLLLLTQQVSTSERFEPRRSRWQCLEEIFHCLCKPSYVDVHLNGPSPKLHLGSHQWYFLFIQANGLLEVDRVLLQKVLKSSQTALGNLRNGPIHLLLRLGPEVSPVTEKLEHLHGRPGGIGRQEGSKDV